jgi:nucleoside-diphosphate-sugar epimerase
MRDARKINCVAPVRSIRIQGPEIGRVRSEPRNFAGDAGLFHRLTGWRAQVDLESGIRDYFKEVLAGAPHGAA